MKYIDDSDVTFEYPAKGGDKTLSPPGAGDRTARRRRDAVVVF
jgi:hypothetical protein